jgi:hypothetical protein
VNLLARDAHVAADVSDLATVLRRVDERGLIELNPDGSSVYVTRDRRVPHFESPHLLGLFGTPNAPQTPKRILSRRRFSALSLHSPSPG